MLPHRGGSNVSHEQSVGSRNQRVVRPMADESRLVAPPESGRHVMGRAAVASRLSEWHPPAADRRHRRSGHAEPHAQPRAKTYVELFYYLSYDKADRLRWSPTLVDRVLDVVDPDEP